MFEIVEQQNSMTARIKVIGIGGGGGNAVNTMISASLSGVDFIVANTDAQSLEANQARCEIQLGGMVTKGLGAGANPEIGRQRGAGGSGKDPRVPRQAPTWSSSPPAWAAARARAARR